MSLTISALNSFSKDPENIEFIDFLVEKTKDVTAPLSIWNLCKEFKTKSGSIQSKGCLLKRIYRFLPLIHELPNIDINTKVKLLFGLSAPINYGFLKELEKHADITIDSARQIIEYKEKGGGLQLKRLQMRAKKVNTLDTKIWDFLAETAKVTDSPISATEFTKRFKISSGTSASIRQLYLLIKKTIYESDFDEETKIRMLYVSGAELHNYVLEELQINAHVEVDERFRIINYKANDGSLILEKKHCYTPKSESERATKLKSADLEASDEEEEEQTDRIVITQSGRLSKITNYFKTPTSEKKKRSDKPMSSNQSTPIRKRTIGGSMVGSTSSRRNSMEEDFSFDDFEPIYTPRRVKLEPFEGFLVDRTILDDNDIHLHFSEQTNTLLVPKQQEQLPKEVKLDRPNYLLFDPPIISSDSVISFDTKHGSVTSLKVFETIHTLVCTLESPDFSPFQTEIEKKMETARTSNEKIPIDGFILALDSFTFKLIRSSKIGETENSIILKDVLLIFKTVLLMSKFNGLDGFLQKLKGLIESPSVANKMISAEKVQSALQAALDIMDL